ncbi:MAG: NAD(P)H-quinone oxidoreductase [Pseudomonadota bacterium]|jgi:putative PIG3 family NAD(P)H quinone oxidoreductase|nr:NAD(P)H-quinone oxidoreductase [Pseudomonadota bacterium]
MKAITIGEDSSLDWSNFPDPELKQGEVLIEVSASAINRADLMQRRGLYPPPAGASPILGLECSGIVTQVSETVDRFKEGDPVCALLAGGGYAQKVAVDQGSVLPVPAGLTLLEAASLPEVYATAWLNLFIEAGLRPGEKVILHAGASGVGTAAIQLCKAFGSPSFVTAGSEEKLAFCRSLGATDGFNRHDGSFLQAAKAFSGAVGVDVVLDPVGGAYLEDNLNVLGLYGRLVLIGLMGGSNREINLGQLMVKRLRVIGSTLRARSLIEKAAIIKDLQEQVWPKISEGEIRPVIDKVFPMQAAAEAQDWVATDQTIGKVVLTNS